MQKNDQRLTSGNSCKRFIKNQFDGNHIILLSRITKRFLILLRRLLLQVFVTVFNFPVSIFYEKTIICLLLCSMLSFVQGHSNWTNEFFVQNIRRKGAGKSFICISKPGRKSKSPLQENWSFFFWISRDLINCPEPLYPLQRNSLLLSFFQLLFYLSQNYSYASHPIHLFITNILRPFWPVIL